MGRCLQGLKKLYENAWGPNGIYYYTVAALGEGPIRKAIPRADRVAIPRLSGTDINPQGTLYQSSNGRVQVWVYDGSQADGTQETASGLSALDPSFITTGSEWNKLAFAVIKVTFFQSTQTSIPDFTFDMEGYRDLYDPRDTTRKYSENRSLWIREVLTNTRWGLKVLSGNIDDTTFSQAANDCAVAIFPATPTAAPTLALNGAGNITGTVWYTFTCANSNGVESTESPLSTFIIASSNQINVTLPAADSVTAKRVIYRSANGDFATRRKVGELAGNGGGTFTDNVTSGTWATGATPPTVAPYNPNRYEGGGLIISRQTQGRDWLNTLRASCLGVLTWDNGKFKLQINTKLAGGYTRKPFSEYFNGATPPNVDPDSITWGRKPRHELPNEVEVRYTDIQNDFGSGSIVKQRASVIAGTEVPRRAVYELADVPDSSYASRIATQLLNLAWDDAEFSWKADRSAIACLPWDVVSFTGAGLSGQDVRIRRIKSDGEDFVISGTEYHDASYSDEVVQADAPLAVGSSGLPSSYSTPPNVSGIAMALEIWTAQTGIQYQRGTLTYTPPDFVFFETVEVYLEIDPTGTGSSYGPQRKWFEAPNSGTLTPPMFETGKYRLTLYTRSRTKQLSSGVTYTTDVLGKVSPPADVPLLVAGANYDGVHLAWQVPPDEDITMYEVRRGATGDPWASMVYIAQTKAHTLIDRPPAGNHRYRVKAIDVAGRYSTNDAYADVAFFPVGSSDSTTTEQGWDANFTADASATRSVSTPFARGGVWKGTGCIVAEETVLAWSPNGPIATDASCVMFLCRQDSPNDAATEQTAASLTSVGAWASSIDDPRRGGAPIWAPLPAFSGAQMNSGEFLCGINASLGRLAEVRSRIVGIADSGDGSSPYAVAHVFPVIKVDTVKTQGPTAAVGPNANLAIKFGMLLTSNSRTYQQIVQSQASPAAAGGSLPSAIVFGEVWDQKSFKIASGTATTDGSGLATVTLSYPAYPSPSSSARFDVVLTAAGTNVIAVVDSYTGGLTFRVKTYNISDGSVAASKPFTYEVWDNGRVSNIAMP